MLNSFQVVLWRWMIRRLRAIVWAADEWIHAQELKLRESAAPALVQAPAEVDRKQSAQRERAFRKSVGRPRIARLKYTGGQFVRVGQ